MLWHAQGVDVDQAMLALSTYVGHAMVTNTYWYLTGVPELMAVAAAKFESFMHAAGGAPCLRPPLHGHLRSHRWSSSSSPSIWSRSVP